MSDAAGAVWYWREGGEQRGPVTWEKLQSMAALGTVGPSHWGFRDGWPDWKLACEAKDPNAESGMGLMGAPGLPVMPGVFPPLPQAGLGFGGPAIPIPPVAFPSMTGPVIPPVPHMPPS